MVARWKGSGAHHVCCRLRGFQQCRAQLQTKNPLCSLAGELDLADYDAQFAEMLKNQHAMDVLILKNCDDAPCRTHKKLSLVTTLLLFTASVVIFAMLSQLVMNRIHRK